MSAVEDQQMKDLRTNLEKELKSQGFEQKVEEELKAQLAKQGLWEAKIKEACLQKIQQQQDLSKVDIELLTN